MVPHVRQDRATFIITMTTVFRVVVVAVVLLETMVASAEKRLSDGQFVFGSKPLPSGETQIEATDGESVLSAVVSSDIGFVKCSVTTDNVADIIERIITDPTAQIKHLGQDQIDDLWERCQVAGVTSKQTAIGGISIIVPGTKWCGNGNIADNYDDLGTHRETDACCREHDHCPYSISGLSRQYGYLNLLPWTLSHCPCDFAFYDCLKHTDSPVSSVVGTLFYGLLGMDCFVFSTDQRTYCDKYHWSQLWCEKYTTGHAAIVQDFPYAW